MAATNDDRTSRALDILRTAAFYPRATSRYERRAQKEALTMQSIVRASHT
jgi:hypothetical protein